MSNQSSLISYIYKSREVILELLETQGYDITNYGHFDSNEINALYENEMLDILVENVDENKKMFVHYYLSGKLTYSKIQNLIDVLFSIEEKLKQTDTLYIITENEPNDTVNDTIKHVWEKDGIFVIVQSIKRLQFNVLKHVLVPPHRILKQDEVEQVKKKYNIMSDANWPDLSRFDPVSKAIFIKPGQVCEIVRPSKTSLVSNYYRICASI
jgi:DNA-directed RNA polymerase subunit H (RpoH/RPB5)